MDLRSLYMFLWATIILTGASMIASLVMITKVLENDMSYITTHCLCLFFLGQTLIIFSAAFTLFLAANAANDAVSSFMIDNSNKAGNAIPRHLLDTWLLRKVLFIVFSTVLAIVDVVIVLLISEQVHSGKLSMVVVVTEVGTFVSLVVGGLALYKYSRRISMLFDPATMADTVYYSADEEEEEGVEEPNRQNEDDNAQDSRNVAPSRTLAKRRSTHPFS